MPDDAITQGGNHNVSRKEGIITLSGSTQPAKIPQDYESDYNAGGDSEDFYLPSNYVGISGMGLYYFSSDYGNLVGFPHTSLNGVGGTTGSVKHWLNSETFVLPDDPGNNSKANYAVGFHSPVGDRRDTPHDYYIIASRHQSNVAIGTNAGFDASVLHIYQIDRNNTTIDFYGNNTGTALDGKFNGYITNIPMMSSLGSSNLQRSTGTGLGFTGGERFAPVYYQGNGAIRICDSGFLDHITSKLWLGYVRDENLFSGNMRGLSIDTFKVDNWVIDYGRAPAMMVDSDEFTTNFEVSEMFQGILMNPQTATLGTEGDGSSNSEFDGWFNNSSHSSATEGAVWGENFKNRVTFLFCRKIQGYAAPSNLVSRSGYSLSLRPSVYAMPDFDGMIGVSIFAKQADGWTANSWQDVADDDDGNAQQDLLHPDAPETPRYIDGDVHGSINLPKRDGASSLNEDEAVRTGGYGVFCSYVYEDGEESILSRFPRFHSDSDNYFLTGQGANAKHHISNNLYGNDMYMDISFFLNPHKKRIHPRVKGVRLYVAVPPDGQQSAGGSSFVYNLLAEMDFEKGSRGAGTVGWKPWIHEADGFKTWPSGTDESEMNRYITVCRTTSLGMESFETNHGYSPEDIGTCFYKTALSINNRVYVGNVKFNDKLYPDRMMKTQVGEYDTFTKNGFIDVTVDDGDSIVHLEGFADRILQFKENIVHVINISKEFEFLESSMKHAGVRRSCQVVNTDKGVYWVNRNGLFWYNGEKIVNLTEIIGENVASDPGASFGSTLTNNEVVTNIAHWGDVISEDDERQPVLGYDPVQKDVLIIRQTNDNNDVSFVFNTTQNSLTQLFHRTESRKKSNIVTNRDGDMLFIKNPTLSQTGAFENDTASTETFDIWNREAQTDNTSRNLFLLTKPITFGNHSQRKVVQSIHFTYKSNGENYLIPYVKAFYLDGVSPDVFYMSTNTDSSVTSVDFVGAEPPGRLPDTSNKFETFKYKHVLDNTPRSGVDGTPVSMRGRLKNVGAIQIGLLKINSNSYSINADFEIEEISITYRDKSFK